MMGANQGEVREQPEVTEAVKIDQATSTTDLAGSVVSGSLWRRVINKAKQALKEARGDPDDEELNL